MFNMSIGHYKSIVYIYLYKAFKWATSYDNWQQLEMARKIDKLKLNEIYGWVTR